MVLIDGTLIPTQRRTGKADRRNYSGKHRRHGLHFLALTDERGRLNWISAARPGRTHDNTAARHDHILTHLRAAGLGALADLGFRGLDNDLLDPVIAPTTPPAAPTSGPGAEGSQPRPRRRTRTGRAQLRPPQELANPHQAPHQPRPRHPTPASPAGPDEPRRSLTDDLHRRLPPTTSMNIPSTGHTRPQTSNFQLAEAQWGVPPHDSRTTAETTPRQ